ncbi:hypothetical protein MMC10_003451 [Thelotrema lepadinum]|nr:hypothetical protein [Thelotrema lepadinum]
MKLYNVFLLATAASSLAFRPNQDSSTEDSVTIDASHHGDAVTAPPPSPTPLLEARILPPGIGPISRKSHPHLPKTKTHFTFTITDPKKTTHKKTHKKTTHKKTTHKKTTSHKKTTKKKTITQNPAISANPGGPIHRDIIATAPPNVEATHVTAAVPGAAEPTITARGTLDSAQTKPTAYASSSLYKREAQGDVPVADPIYQGTPKHHHARADSEISIEGRDDSQTADSSDDNYASSSYSDDSYSTSAYSDDSYPTSGYSDDSYSTASGSDSSYPTTTGSAYVVPTNSYISNPISDPPTTASPSLKPTGAPLLPPYPLSGNSTHHSRSHSHSHSGHSYSHSSSPSGCNSHHPATKTHHPHSHGGGHNASHTYTYTGYLPSRPTPNHKGDPPAALGASGYLPPNHKGAPPFPPAALGASASASGSGSGSGTVSGSGSGYHPHNPTTLTSYHFPPTTARTTGGGGGRLSKVTETSVVGTGLGVVGSGIATVGPPPVRATVTSSVGGVATTTKVDVTTSSPTVTPAVSSVTEVGSVTGVTGASEKSSIPLPSSDAPVSIPVPSVSLPSSDTLVSIPVTRKAKRSVGFWEGEGGGEAAPTSLVTYWT